MSINSAVPFFKFVCLLKVLITTEPIEPFIFHFSKLCYALSYFVLKFKSLDGLGQFLISVNKQGKQILERSFFGQIIKNLYRKHIFFLNEII